MHFVTAQLSYFIIYEKYKSHEEIANDESRFENIAE